VALPAKWFVLLYGIIELWAGVTGTLAGVAHFAHLGGMLFGLLLLMYWRSHPPE
jgi:membrane associated rhomboid family serine protease